MPIDAATVATALASLIPMTLLAGAAGVSSEAPFRKGGWVAADAAVLALGVAVARGVAGPWAPTAPGAWVRTDAVTCVVLLLVTSLGWIVVRYSRTYLLGDPGRERYVRWLLATLAAVTTLAIANHLVLLAVAWTATSVTLHQLLTFYSDRTAALVAAHKKFLVSRLADVCLWVGLALVYAQTGTWNLDELAARVTAQAELPLELHVAAVAFAVAACLRSAQVPFHGWLTQVMEAPTPVSALLHAGVVNLGAVLLVRLSPLLALAPAAQWVLVIVGMITVVVASLVTTTRVSVKVALAWSTCAQMGFMLVECGLGLWPLAILHLVAHSAYKAHAFLSAGSAVDAWRLAASAPVARVPTGARLAGGVMVAALGTAAFADLVEGPSVLVLGLLVCLALVPFLAGGRDLPTRVVRSVVVVVSYGAAHSVATWLLARPGYAEVGWGPWSVVAVGLAALFTVHAVVVASPGGRIAAWLHPWLFAGLFLDERFTRLTFRVWPPRLPAAAPRRPVPVVAPLES